MRVTGTKLQFPFVTQVPRLNYFFMSCNILMPLSRRCLSIDPPGNLSNLVSRRSCVYGRRFRRVVCIAAATMDDDARKVEIPLFP